jgi:hypothetical protein
LLASRPVELEQAIRSRRTHKAYGSERHPEGRAAVGLSEGERAVGLPRLGPARQEKEPPSRNPPGDYVTFLP